MVWLVLIVVAVVLAAAVAALVAGRLPYDPMAAPVRTTPATGLPEQPRAADVDAVRFDTAARGYRMSEVDDALDTLQARLVAQEGEIARLREERGEQAERAEEPEQPEEPEEPEQAEPVAADARPDGSPGDRA